MKEKISNFFIIVVSTLFMLFMLLNTILVFFKTAIFPRDYQETLYYKTDNVILNIVMLFLFSTVIFFLSTYLKKILKTKRLVLLVMIYAFIVSLFFAILRRDYVQFDPFNVIDQASNFLRDNYSGLEKGENYLYIYSHQLTTVFLFELVLGIFGRATFILYLLQCLSISYIIFMLYKITDILFNNEEVNYLVIVLLIFCFPLFFYVAFIYGLLPGMFLVLLTFYNFLKYFKTNKWYNLVIATFSINIAILFISNNLINMLATIAIIIIIAIQKIDKKLIVFVISTFLVMIVSKNIIFNYYEVRSGKDIPTGIHKISWIAMGMQEGDREAGWWNGFNYDIYIEEGYNNDTVKEISLKSIDQRLSVFKNNPGYAFNFYTRKYENQLLEPTFQSLLVTSPQEDFKDETLLLKVKTITLRELYYGTTNKILFYIMKSFQMFVYIGSLVFSYISLRKKNIFYLLIPVSFIGGTIFHVIWEAKSRYIFPYFIFLIPLASYGMIHIKNKLLDFKIYKGDKICENLKN